jgi:hypothetical protein
VTSPAGQWEAARRDFGGLMLASLDAGRLAGAWALTIGQVGRFERAGEPEATPVPDRPAAPAAVRAADLPHDRELAAPPATATVRPCRSAGTRSWQARHNLPGRQHPPQQPPAKTGRDPSLDDRDRYPAGIRGRTVAIMERAPPGAGKHAAGALAAV